MSEGIADTQTNNENQPGNAKDFWDAKADGWVQENDENRLTRRREAVLTFLERHITSGTALDIGCGDGSLCFELSRRGFDVYGCDVSEKLVTASRKRLAGLRADADDRIRLIENNRIPFDRTFDLITILGVLIYIPQHLEYLREVAAHLNPGGLLVASSTQRFSLRTVYDVVRHLVRPQPVNPEWRRGIVNLLCTGTWSGGFMPAKGSGRTFSVWGLEKSMRRAGFEPVDRLYVYHLEALDGCPLARSVPGTALSRVLGWRQTVAARRRGETPCE